MCSIVYVELEGFKKGKNIIIDEAELAVNIISDIKDLQTSEKSKLLFRERFQTKLVDLHYWKVRNEFNDVSKTYVFVLLAHATIGKN